LLLFFFRWCGGMRLYAHVMPVCSIDAPAVSGVVLELWPSVWDRDACIQSYRGLWFTITIKVYQIYLISKAQQVSEEAYHFINIFP